ncbi:MAG: hypothetical protein NXI27_07060 [Alphaproteobacteria bacterium]|nr:hypothetical protein [Alphaproteobacteria bacterium]
MDDFEIEVIGVGPPRKPDGPLKRVSRWIGRKLRALLMRPRALVFTGAAAFMVIIGTPHTGWEYECRHPMRSGQPCKSVSYCAYYGIQGRRVVFPQHGESCKIITLLPLDFSKLIGG